MTKQEKLAEAIRLIKEVYAEELEEFDGGDTMNNIAYKACDEDFQYDKEFSLFLAGVRAHAQLDLCIRVDNFIYDHFHAYDTATLCETAGKAMANQAYAGTKYQYRNVGLESLAKDYLTVAWNERLDDIVR